eukprot:TRINITY_DN7410_c0_g1_i1.p1 TRINITY_DN7410_c0_g1~~TRINITY_DN7410_c0_g1_i1.p1  ORF type:complete len:212 (-),score=9.45 TRINITY_DN7410_c0_g1_i1:215-850(-)
MIYGEHSRARQVRITYDALSLDTPNLFKDRFRRFRLEAVQVTDLHDSKRSHGSACLWEVKTADPESLKQSCNRVLVFSRAAEDAMDLDLKQGCDEVGNTKVETAPVQHTTKEEGHHSAACPDAPLFGQVSTGDFGTGDSGASVRHEVESSTSTTTATCIVHRPNHSYNSNSSRPLADMMARRPPWGGWHTCEHERACGPFCFGTHWNSLHE